MSPIPYPLYLRTEAVCLNTLHPGAHCLGPICEPLRDDDPGAGRSASGLPSDGRRPPVSAQSRRAWPALGGSISIPKRHTLLRRQPRGVFPTRMNKCSSPRVLPTKDLQGYASPTVGKLLCRLNRQQGFKARPYQAARV